MQSRCPNTDFHGVKADVRVTGHSTWPPLGGIAGAALGLQAMSSVRKGVVKATRHTRVNVVQLPHDGKKKRQNLRSWAISVQVRPVRSLWAHTTETMVQEV